MRMIQDVFLSSDSIKPYDDSNLQSVLYGLERCSVGVDDSSN